MAAGVSLSSGMPAEEHAAKWLCTKHHCEPTPLRLGSLCTGLGAGTVSTRTVERPTAADAAAASALSPSSRLSKGV